MVCVVKFVCFGRGFGEERRIGKGGCGRRKELHNVTRKEVISFHQM